MKFLASLIAAFKEVLAEYNAQITPINVLPETPKNTPQSPVPEPAPVSTPTPPKPTPAPKIPEKTPSEVLYTTAKGQLGRHLSLDETVPIDVGCAEAVSKVLKLAGYRVPPKGIPGTAQLLTFLQVNKAFKEVSAYEVGAIIISATGTGNGSLRGHTGVCGNNSIMSNNSATGLWDTQWNLSKWDAYYRRKGGIPTRYFRPII